MSEPKNQQESFEESENHKYDGMSQGSKMVKSVDETQLKMSKSLSAQISKYGLVKRSVCSRLGLAHSFFTTSTEFCQHDFGCLENITKGGMRSFVIGYGIKASISVAGLVFGFKKLLKKYKSRFSHFLPS